MEGTQQPVGDRSKFNNLVEEVGIAFIKYPVSGVYPYLPYGAKMFLKLKSILETLLLKEGHEPILFPSLIPLNLFKREIDFFEGFSPEALLAEQTLSGRKLEEPLVLRPTSEVPIYYVFSQLINSWQQLPLKVYQTVTVYRIETKATAPFFRLREVTGFNEAHAFARDEAQAEHIFKAAINIYSTFLKELGIPFLIVESPHWDLFPGARRNVDFITILPDGKLLELASVIDLGDKFAKAFEIIYQDSDGKNKFVKQITYGIGLDRVLGTLLWLAMDNKGFILHPKIAPIQAVIVPIFYNQDELNKILNYINKKIKPLLEELNLEYVIDVRERTPGYKFYYWERRGIPLRMEVGKREVEQNTVTIYRRDTNTRITINIRNLNERINTIIASIENNIRNILSINANKLLKENTFILDIPLEKPICKKIEERQGLDTIGKIIDVYGFEADLLGKVLFGRKY